MSISNKYNIPQETVKRMIDDGFLSCSIPKYEEIYEMFQSSMRVPGAIKSRVILTIADKSGYSERQVRTIIERIK